MKQNKLAQENLNIKNFKFAIVVSNWNEIITSNLLNGSLTFFSKYNVGMDSIFIVKCSGAFELPLTCQFLCESKKYDGIVALGCIIRGDTPHFEFVSNETSSGIMNTMLKYDIPIGFGLLTVDTYDQAVLRSNDNVSNKGYEAAQAVSEMLILKSEILEG